MSVEGGEARGVMGLASVVPELYVSIYQAVLVADLARANVLQQQAIAALQMITFCKGFWRLTLRQTSTPE